MCVWFFIYSAKLFNNVSDWQEGMYVSYEWNWNIHNNKNADEITYRINILGYLLK